MITFSEVSCCKRWLDVIQIDDSRSVLLTSFDIQRTWYCFRNGQCNNNDISIRSMNHYIIDSLICCMHNMKHYSRVRFFLCTFQFWNFKNFIYISKRTSIRLVPLLDYRIDWNIWCANSPNVNSVARAFRGRLYKTLNHFFNHCFVVK